MFIASLFIASKIWKQAKCSSADDKENMVCIYVFVYMLVTQSCLTLYEPLDCSPPGSSVHDILQAWILEWVAISLSRGSSQPRDWTQVACIAGRFFKTEHDLKKEGNSVICDMDEPEDIMLNEINQSENYKYYMIPLIWSI